MNTKLSIVTISYQNLDGLRKTITSLLGQSNFNFEQIIVDGASNDGTLEYLKGLSVPWKLKWVSEKDQGRYDAMNKGTFYASGTFVWYLNAGDYVFDSHVINDLLEKLKDNPNIDLLYGKIIFETPYGRFISGQESSTEDFKFAMPVSHPAIVFRRLKIMENPYRTDFQIISDWILVRKLFSNSSGRVTFFNRILTIFDTQGISSTNLLQDIGEKLRYNSRWSYRISLVLHQGFKVLVLTLLHRLRLYGLYKKWKSKLTIYISRI